MNCERIHRLKYAVSGCPYFMMLDWFDYESKPLKILQRKIYAYVRRDRKIGIMGMAALLGNAEYYRELFEYYLILLDYESLSKNMETSGADSRGVLLEEKK